MDREQLIVFKKFVLELSLKMPIFVRFLKDNGCFTAYVRASRSMISLIWNGLYDHHHFLTHMHNHFLNQIISAAFVWKDVDNGEDYWFNIYNLWKERMKDIPSSEKERMRDIAISLAKEKYPTCLCSDNISLYH